MAVRRKARDPCHAERQLRMTLLTCLLSKWRPHSSFLSPSRALTRRGQESSADYRVSVCIISAPPHPRPIPPTFAQTRHTQTAADTSTTIATSCHAPVINFHAPAERCVAFVRIYGATRPPQDELPGQRDREVGRSRPRGSRKRLIFQGNTWRDISACIRWMGVRQS